jgi:hypothetical protein
LNKISLEKYLEDVCFFREESLETGVDFHFWGHHRKRNINKYQLPEISIAAILG